jgi:imidazole glycerol-phosphate synthase subunit HisH
MIAIVHYGLGNVHALAEIYKRLGIGAMLAETPEQLRSAQRIVLPGVGAFDWAMTRLNDSGLRAALEHAVGVERKPVLGICVGMQMLASRSDEGRLPGLGWIAGDVKRFDVSAFSHPTHLPHMGWNDVEPRGDSRLFAGLDAASRFYFLHSYYFAPLHAHDVLASTSYHGTFASAVGAGNVFGVQFHPEKSHQWGIRLLKNFAEL